jgi:hypothetical protein
MPGIAAIPGELQIQSKRRGGCRCRNWEGSVKAVATGSVAEKAAVGLRPQDAVPGSRRQFRLLALEARMVWSVAKKRLRGSAVPGNPHEHRVRKAGSLVHTPLQRADSWDSPRLSQPMLIKAAPDPKRGDAL